MLFYTLRGGLVFLGLQGGYLSVQLLASIRSWGGNQ
jgi:hypothetical protein